VASSPPEDTDLSLEGVASLFPSLSIVGSAAAAEPSRSKGSGVLCAAVTFSLGRFCGSCKNSISVASTLESKCSSPVAARKTPSMINEYNKNDR
jgi:hypothetical protein